MRIAEAHGVCLAIRETFPISLTIRRCAAEAPALGPHDQGRALALLNVHGTMPPLPRMNYATAADMSVRVVKFAMTGFVEHATEGEVVPLKCLMGSNTKVEGHVALVNVHVQMLVISRAVLHDESVMIVQGGATPVLRSNVDASHGLDPILIAAEEPGTNWQKNFLQHGGKGGSQANLIQDQAIVVHTVGGTRWEATGPVVLNFCQKHVAELVRESWEAADAWSFDSEAFKARQVDAGKDGVCASFFLFMPLCDGVQQGWMHPAPPICRIKELLVQGLVGMVVPRLQLSLRCGALFRNLFNLHFGLLRFVVRAVQLVPLGIIQNHGGWASLAADITK
mmetsp:Transcript_33493/g.77210  ORF Transcript_33493/g.77210 Transcript_33493/m.77210 type:complete len:337 (+) Transcript_33493:644-1654(+)